MRIRFNYEFMGRIFPCIIFATEVYFDPADSTLNISDGKDWWEVPMEDTTAYEHLEYIMRDGEYSIPTSYLFRFCK